MRKDRWERQMRKTDEKRQMKKDMRKDRWERTDRGQKQRTKAKQDKQHNYIGHRLWTKSGTKLKHKIFQTPQDLTQNLSVSCVTFLEISASENRRNFRQTTNRTNGKPSPTQEKQQHNSNSNNNLTTGKTASPNDLQVHPSFAFLKHTLKKNLRNSRKSAQKQYESELGAKWITSEFCIESSTCAGFSLLHIWVCTTYRTQRDKRKMQMPGHLERESGGKGAHMLWEDG